MKRPCDNIGSEYLIDDLGYHDNYYYVVIQNHKYILSEAVFQKISRNGTRKIDVALFNDVVCDHKMNKAKHNLLMLLKTRSLTKQDIRLRLFNKMSEVVIKEFIKELEQAELINDRQCARDVISYYAQNGFGIHYIKRKLIEKGLGQELDLLSLFDLENDDIINEQLMRIKQKNVNLPYQRQIEQALTFFYQRGFDLEVVKPIITEGIPFIYHDEVKLIQDYLRNRQVTRDEVLFVTLLKLGYNKDAVTEVLSNDEQE
ncbi:MAG: RecX family transcriptional regulator [Erysipelotrichaceae bacterium]|jgi:SOS response regulatory protein OraA/RecX|nr:RecX family transcriptional regulator [Erysipelotrichaceae bacterium]